MMYVTLRSWGMAHILIKPMKRILQFVVLVVVVLLAAQPLSACTFCMQSSENCAPACCSTMSGMGGMSDMSSVQAIRACMASMDSTPVDSGCDQAASSMAFLPRTAATLAPQQQSRVSGLAQDERVESSLVPLGLGQVTRWSDAPVSVTPSRTILFQVFRI